MYPASGEGSNLPPLKPLPQLEKYDPPEKNAARAKKSHKWYLNSHNVLIAIKYKKNN